MKVQPVTRQKILLKRPEPRTKPFFAFSIDSSQSAQSPPGMGTGGPRPAFSPCFSFPLAPRVFLLLLLFPSGMHCKFLHKSQASLSLSWFLVPFSLACSVERSLFSYEFCLFVCLFRWRLFRVAAWMVAPPWSISDARPLPHRECLLHSSRHF